MSNISLKNKLNAYVNTCRDISGLQLAHSFPSLVTIPQVVAVNENVFSVNLPGNITVK
jgi:hypothetical protein